jgi:hypothetical protein
MPELGGGRLRLFGELEHLQRQRPRRRTEVGVGEHQPCDGLHQADERLAVELVRSTVVLWRCVQVGRLGVHSLLAGRRRALALGAGRLGLR